MSEDEIPYVIADSPQSKINANFYLLQVHCPKHGTHPHTITCNVKGNEGTWCQLCWIETLGQSLPSGKLPYDLTKP